MIQPDSNIPEKDGITGEKTPSDQFVKHESTYTDHREQPSSKTHPDNEILGKLTDVIRNELKDLRTIGEKLRAVIEENANKKKDQTAPNIYFKLLEWANHSEEINAEKNRLQDAFQKSLNSAEGHYEKSINVALKKYKDELDRFEEDRKKLDKEKEEFENQKREFNKEQEELRRNAQQWRQFKEETDAAKAILIQEQKDLENEQAKLDVSRRELDEKQSEINKLKEEFWKAPKGFESLGTFFDTIYSDHVSDAHEIVPGEDTDILFMVGYLQIFRGAILDGAEDQIMKSTQEMGRIIFYHRDPDDPLIRNLRGQLNESFEIKRWPFEIFIPGLGAQIDPQVMIDLGGGKGSAVETVETWGLRDKDRGIVIYKAEVNPHQDD